jgi:hypothetical protein
MTIGKFVATLPALLICCIIAAGCAGSGNPIDPSSKDSTLSAQRGGAVPANTQLWGYFDVTLDPVSKTVTSVPNRQAMFTLNVVKFLNNSPLNLNFKVNGFLVEDDYSDLDVDITLYHPLPGLPQYSAYDVRGVFMGNGLVKMKHDKSLKHSKLGSDQFMLNDPVDSKGGPDGYTRWFNATEFTTSGLAGYTPGRGSTPGYSGNATINPYKYFCDGIGTQDKIGPWLLAHPDATGIFSSGSTCTRNYYLRFPASTGFKFGYAVIANWEPDGQPANAPEAIACYASVTDNIFYVNNQNHGGTLILDIGVFDWGVHQLSAGAMEDYRILVESTVFGGNHVLTPTEMIPTGSGNHYYTFHTEIPATGVNTSVGNEFWISVQYTGYDYNSPTGIPNVAGDDPVTAMFRYDLYVSSITYPHDPICNLTTITPMPYVGFGNVEFYASSSYDPDITPLTYTWDFDGDNVFGEDPDDSYTGDPPTPAHIYKKDYSGPVNLHIEDGNGGKTDCSIDVDVSVLPIVNPICSMYSVTPMPHSTKDPVEFDASLSYHPYHLPLTYEWDFDADGAYGEQEDDAYTGKPTHPVHYFPSSYNGPVSVRVTDMYDGLAICSTDVQINLPPNTPPVCDLQLLSPFPDVGNGEVSFDASGSYDPDGDPLTYKWDFDGDFVYDEPWDDSYLGTPAKPMHKYTASFDGEVHLKVKDPFGGEDVCSRQIGLTVYYSETFDQDPAGWTYVSYQPYYPQEWETVGWSDEGPFGPSGSGALHLGSDPYYYNYFGSLSTVITPPFEIPSGFKAVFLRVYMCEGSDPFYLVPYEENSNWKMVESNTPGLDPFISDAYAPLPVDGVHIQNAIDFGSTGWGYSVNQCTYGPLMGQPGWYGEHGGGAFPPSLDEYMDLTIPPEYFGKMVKLAWQWQAYDYYYYYGPLGPGYAIDDIELWFVE